jgi:transposase
MIVNRLIHPCSKLATARELHAQTAASSLHLQLDLHDFNDRSLYETLDWLLVRQTRIENKLAQKHLRNGSILLYDLSSSYYTGTHCPLAKFGYDRDKKRRFPQIVYGLLCDLEGRPISIEVFPGNTADTKTLGSQIKKIRDRFCIKRVIIVGARGMITSKRIEEDFQGMEGLDWITALRTESIRKLIDQGTIQPSLFDERDLAEIYSPDFPDERLVVCRNPFLAEERRGKREALLKATEKKLDEIVKATQRAQRALKGKEKIGLRVGRVLNCFKVGKHFEVHMEEDRFSYHRNLEKIEAEARLDGLYVIRSSVPRDLLDADQLVQAYKDLGRVERAFRSLKTMNLKIRPIFHRLEDRVRAHAFLCMLAYYVEWHMRKKWAPVLFEEENVEEGRAMRTSVVAPAVRSPQAQQKDHTKQTKDGFPIHSFETIIRDLATLNKNRVQSPGTDPAEFYLNTEATPFQRYALELLGVSESG